MANAGQMHVYYEHHTPVTPVETNSHISARNHVLDSLDMPDACVRNREHYQCSQPAVRLSLSRILH